MIFRVYKFATSSGVQINWIEKNGEVHRRRAFLIIYVSFFFLWTMFVRHRWFRHRSEGRYRRNNIPITTADFALRTSVTIYVSNYRALPMRIEPVGVFIIKCLILDNRTFLPSYKLSSSFLLRILLVPSWKREERKKTIIYYYPCIFGGSFIKQADFPLGKRICLCLHTF